MTLLSINAGSSSLKVAVFEDNSPDAPFDSVSIEGIGTPDACLIPGGAYGSPDTKKLPIDTPMTAAKYVAQWLSDDLSITQEDITAIGYRVVHGGEDFTEATIVTDEVVARLNHLTPLAPNHMPATLASIEAFRSAYPKTNHVACFDTSFFRDLPNVATILPINRAVAEKHGIRRFGFHGLSYEYLLENFREHEGEEAASGRIVIAHLGSGASVTACLNGKPVDTSMGFTPVSGIMMSTRSGDLEPGVATYLQKNAGLSIDEVSKILTYESGLLGVSGKTADMYTLLQTQSSDENVAEAVDLFCYKIAKQIGAYAAVLGGIDSIIFSGGIGERSAEIRARILEKFTFMQLAIDKQRNDNNERLISTDDSAVGVHIIQTREDATIMKQTLALTNEGGI